MRTYQPERALIARETRRGESKRAGQHARPDRHGAGSSTATTIPVSLEAQFQESIRKIREDVQRAKDVQSAHILRWLQS